MKLANNILVQTEAGSFAPKKQFNSIVYILWFITVRVKGGLIYNALAKIRRSNTNGYKNM